MAYLVQKDVVLIECGCGCLKPIIRLFLCRFCMKVRCGYCLCHEIDCCFCSHCSISLPPVEARTRKNRCSSCLDCPSCFQTLSLRATSAGRVASVEETPPNVKTSVKYFYLSCSFCRWSTRDVDLPDQTVAIGGWPEKEHPNSGRISELMDYYKAISARDKKEKDKKMGPVGHIYGSFHSHGLTQSLARRKAGLPALHYVRDVSTITVPPIQQAEAEECAERLPEEVFTKAVDISKISTLPQRLAHPDFQPELCPDFYPIKKHLILRKSARCWMCEHNVLKPEIQPICVKHKLNTSCFYHMPEVRIVSMDPFHAGEASNIVLKFINPFGYNTSIRFNSLDMTEVEGSEDVPVTKISKYDSEKSEFGRVRKVKITASCDIHNRIVVLQPKNSAADFDDTPDLIPTENSSDTDENCLWTKNNKSAIRVAVTPNSDLKAGDSVVIGFSLIYSFLHSNAGPEAPSELNLSFRVFLLLNKISEMKQE